MMVPFSLLLFWPSLSPRHREVMLGHSVRYFVKFSDALREMADEPRITRMPRMRQRKRIRLKMATPGYDRKDYVYACNACVVYNLQTTTRMFVSVLLMINRIYYQPS